MVSFEPIFLALLFKPIWIKTIFVYFTTTAPLADNTRTVFTLLPHYLPMANLISLVIENTQIVLQQNF